MLCVCVRVRAVSLCLLPFGILCVDERFLTPLLRFDTFIEIV